MDIRRYNGKEVKIVSVFSLDEIVEESERALITECWEMNEEDKVNCIRSLATEIIALRKELATLRLLIQHEEEIRITKPVKTKAKKATPKFNVGDRVKLIDGTKVGTIKKITKVDVQVRWNDGTQLYHKSNRLEHSSV